MDPSREPSFAPGRRFRAEFDHAGLTLHQRPLTFGEYFRTSGLPLLIIGVLGASAGVDAVIRRTALAIGMFCAMTLLAGLIIAGERRTRRMIKKDSRVLTLRDGRLTVLRTTSPFVAMPAQWPLERIRQIGGWQLKDGMHLRLWLTDGESIDLLTCEATELEWLAAVLNGELVRQREFAADPRAEVRPE